jgi:hypothetical protein
MTARPSSSGNGDRRSAIAVRSPNRPITSHVEAATMNWRFCPHCETQLDDETGICPACRWDPLDVEPEPEPEARISLVERYRGTEYDTSLSVSVTAQRPSGHPFARGLAVLAVTLLAVLGLYGSMMGWTVFNQTVDRPAVAAGPSGR